MIEYINDHTVRLTPDTPKKRVIQRPRKCLGAMERKIAGMAVEALKNAMDERLWLQRQLRRAADYQRALDAARCVKGKGLPGYVCPPNAKILLRPGEAQRWIAKS